MTELEWHAADDPWSLWHHVADLDLLSERKKRMFCVAACRRVVHLIVDPRSQRMIDACEAYADGQIDQDQLIAFDQKATEAAVELEAAGASGERCLAARGVTWLGPDDYKLGRAASYSYEVFGFRALVSAGLTEPAPLNRDVIGLWHNPIFLAAQAVEMRAQAGIVRELFGNPFDLVVFSHDWSTSDVVAMARGMYETRDFAAMPILADALQDAGCENEQVLHHCRDENAVHVRGCWVVDLVLEKA